MRAPMGTFVADMTTRIPRKTRRDPPLKVPNATVMLVPDVRL